ncbi:hypothetical protein [Haloarcula rubripromontorii]|uniref:hypothetical protein n=1 Tax=Haloarcula rubripromontorii TaxID=1705562 RepID=UPI00345B87DA
MSDTDKTQDPKTLEALAQHRRDRNLPTQVYVTGTGRHFPEDVEETARRVAEMIAGDDGGVLESDFDRVGPDDVALLEISSNVRDRTGDVDELRNLATVARASAYAGIVGYTSDVHVPKSLLEVIDAVIEVDENGVDFVGGVRTDLRDGDIYKLELDSVTDNTP